MTPLEICAIILRAVRYPPGEKAALDTENKKLLPMQRMSRSLQPHL
jgi:hypothetical protein